MLSNSHREVSMLTQEVQMEEATSGAGCRFDALDKCQVAKRSSFCVYFVP
jgi:hypothetical protein